jgi:hypothetical protein
MILVLMVTHRVTYVAAFGVVLRGREERLGACGDDSPMLLSEWGYV